MISIAKKEDCCGCMACTQTCPHACISVHIDHEGFVYPRVDTDKCVECGLCKKVCPILNTSKERTPLRVLAAKNKDVEVLRKSSSGGVFYDLAIETIRHGGVVFGAYFDDNWNVRHGYADDIDGIEKFLASKYVQSSIGETYKQAKLFLQSGRDVLYTGTPCQIAGLYSYLHRSYDNLITLDFLCHGVPSPKVWGKYLEEVKENVLTTENSVSSSFTRHAAEGKSPSEKGEVKIEGISFRDKRLGWKKYSFIITLAKVKADGKKNTVAFSYTHRENAYMRGFLTNLYLRPSCHQCKFKRFQSQSDITLADFWSICKVVPDFYDHLGVSLVFINTEKGQLLFDNGRFETRECSMDSAASNHGLREEVPMHRKRTFFFSHIDDTDSMERLILKCVTPTVCEKIKYRIRRFFR